MKNKYLLLSLIILLSSINSLQAQDLAIGLTGDIGFNKITNIEDAIIGLDLDPSTGFTNSTVSVLDYKEKNFVLSGNLGFFIEKKIGKKSAIILKCLWMQVKGTGTVFPITSTTNGINGGLGNYQIVGQPYLVNGDSTTNNVENFTGSSKKIRLNYLAMPIIYRYKINKLGVTGGILPMFGLSAQGIYSQKTATINGTEEAYPIRDFVKLNLGITVGLDYEIGKQMRIKAAYYQGVRDIRESTYYQNKSTTRQINLGLAYIFWKNNNTRRK